MNHQSIQSLKDMFGFEEKGMFLDRVVTTKDGIKATVSIAVVDGFIGIYIEDWNAPYATIFEMSIKSGENSDEMLPSIVSAIILNL